MNYLNGSFTKKNIQTASRYIKKVYSLISNQRKAKYNHRGDDITVDWQTCLKFSKGHTRNGSKTGNVFMDEKKGVICCNCEFSPASFMHNSNVHYVRS